MSSTRRTLNPPFHALLLPAVPCFAFQVALLIKCMMCMMMRYRPTYLLLSLIVVRVVAANGILETHGLPAFARGTRPPTQVAGGSFHVGF